MVDSNLNFEVPESLFQNIKFFVTGEVPDKVVDLLKTGGAERLNYISDYVTHLICGSNSEENDIADANDLYEIPAVTPIWVYMCCKLRKVVATKPYIYNLQKLFSNLTFCLSKPGKDLEVLWAVITYHGGLVQLNFDRRCSYLVTVDTTTAKYEKAQSIESVTIVTPDWIIECVKNNTLIHADLFHPKRIQWPRVVKHESTTAITGFEPEKGQTDDDSVADSTQALLEKLKQRMPWNQPQTTAADIVPPNVVAPSFLNKTQEQPVRAQVTQQASFVQPQTQQNPRSIVHHTPQPLQMMQQQQQQQQNFNLTNQIHLNRLIGQAQNRPAIQQMRGQLPPNQLHQQLLQQRIAQQNQAQRPVNIQQQLLQQARQQQQIGQPQIAQQQQQPQQNQQFVSSHLLQQQNLVLQHQQNQGQILQQQQQQAQVLQQQQQQPNQILQQKIFSQQVVQQTQPNLAVQQQFVSQSQPQPQQQQFNQQQPQQQNQAFEQVAQSPQFQQQNTLINQQLIQFNQQPQNQQRPQINQQQLWQQQQQQQQQQQPQMTVRHPGNVVQQGARVQWSPNQQTNQLPQRQFIQLDAQTHNQLQKMPPEQQALFVARLQKQKQFLMQKQLQQRPGGSHILIRGPFPHGLSPQQQMQWLQTQAKQQGVLLPPNIQQQTITQPAPAATPTLQQQQHTPGLSPIQQQQQQPQPQQQQQAQFQDQNQQQQLQLRQYRLHQLQLQREQAQKSQLVSPQPQAANIQQPGIIRPLGPVNVADSTTTQQQVQDSGVAQQQLVVNAKTKTALANMLSIRLQSGGANVGPGTEPLPEPSAAGTLRLMTAQHNAALNPNNRPQDLIALQQRRVINGPNGEIIRPPVPAAVPVTPTNEPPKLQFSPRAAVPLQHRPGPFYGHNPNLKLPPDLFLLGCIFVVVEIERYLDESIPDWQQKIEKHGGEVEKQYCSRVTHVLCETQRHGVVMQALRDCKRCITIYWLSDVMKRKQVLPPWTALHLPTIYLDTTPAAKHLIALSGFYGSDRNRVKHMIKYTGAKFTSYFSKHNTILIAAKGDGSKHVHAKKWGIPVVNVQWLTDVMLGNFTALNQMEHIMYQQFPAQPNFSFDPKLIPNLMHAWKMPINISQESYERVKRSASPVLMPKKAKKLKTEQTDENDNVNNQTETNPHYKILFSMCSDLESLKKIVKQLGGQLAKSHFDCTHLVMPSLARSNKLLFCVCREVHIVPERWLRDSGTAGKFVDETNYTLDTKDFNSEFKCDFAQTLATRNRCRLFEGKFFWVTPSVFPSKSVLTELIQNCGGIVERIRRTSAQIEATNVNSPYSYIIITHENDIHLVADLLKSKKDKIRIVCSAELIFSAILKQTFEVEPFAVKVL